MKQCPYCNAQIADDSKFCGECGKEIPQGTVCYHCGASVNENDSFCPNCGKNLKKTSTIEQIVYNEERPKSRFKKYMPYIIGVIALIAICGGGWWYFNSSKAPQSNNEVAVAEAVEADSITVEDTEKTSERDIKLITEWYDYVFGKKEISDDVLDKFLSSKVKKSLLTEDYDGCYECWIFRTIAQDYDHNVGDISKIEDISVNSDGWYEVKYLDMGYKGKTTIKIDNTKIVDFVPDSSWSNNDSSVGNRADDETIADDNSDNSSSAYNSSNTSSSARTFANEQYVVGYLANQTFRSSNGFTIRFDGSGRMYAEGDFAGVVSVLYFNSKSAMLRYGGGQYTEGRVRVDIVGDKLQLKDPEDGTIYYQR